MDQAGSVSYCGLSLGLTSALGREAGLTAVEPRQRQLKSQLSICALWLEVFCALVSLYLKRKVHRSPLRTSYIPQKEDSFTARAFYVCYLPLPKLWKYKPSPSSSVGWPLPIRCGLFCNHLDIAIDFSECQRDFKSPDYSRKEFNANNSTRPDLHKEQREEKGFSSFSLREVRRWLKKLVVISQARTCARDRDIQSRTAAVRRGHADGYLAARPGTTWDKSPALP